jgi:hypothetical protein
MKTYADKPITWQEMQTLLSDLGYDLASHNTQRKTCSFVLRQGAQTENRRNPITVLHPDKFDHRSQEPAYERDYVVDLFTLILGGNGEGISLILKKK